PPAGASGPEPMDSAQQPCGPYAASSINCAPVVIQRVVLQIGPISIELPRPGILPFGSGDESGNDAGDEGDHRTYGEPVTFQGRRVYQRAIDWLKRDPRGKTGLERALDGRPPLGPDGNPIVLHHLLQEEPGPRV